MVNAAATVCLLGAHRWHRADAVTWAIRSGLRPLVIVNPGEETTETLDPSIPVLTGPDPAAKSTFIPRLTDSIRAVTDGKWYVLGLDDYVCRIAAALSTASALPCFPLDSALVVTQKHLVREQWNRLCLSRADLPLQPVPSLSVLFDSFSADQYQLSPSGWSSQVENEGPFIIKPDSLDASIGLRRARTYREAIDAARSAARGLAEYVPASKILGFDLQPAILIDQEVPRSPALPPHAEYTAHLVTRNGHSTMIGISSKLINESTFTKIGQLFPANDLPSKLVEASRIAMEELIQLLRVEYAISNWDFIVTPDERVALLEGHLRPAGDGLMDLIWLASGKSPYATLFDFLKDRDDRAPFPRPTGVAARYYLRPAMPLQKIESVHRDSVDTDRRSIWIDEAGMLAATNWIGPVVESAKLASVSAVGTDLRIVQEMCLDAAQGVKLKGVVDGHPMITTLTLPFAPNSGGGGL
jgi:hypothetical protein